MTTLTDQPYQVMPPLTEVERHALRQSIEKNGVLEPVVFDEDGEILDGHHRVAIAEELDIEYPRRVLAGLDHAGKLRYAITTNAVRRQLAPAQVSSMIADLRIKGMSIRQIAEATGASVGKVHKDLQVFTDEHLPEKITGSDGKQHPATRPTPSPGPTGAAHCPPADAGATPDCLGVDMDCGRPLPCPDHPVLDLGAAPAPANLSPSAPARESDPTPRQAAVPSTAPASPGSGEEAAPTREGGAASKPPPPPSLRLDPTEDEKRAAVQRDARGLLLRVVEILAPVHDRSGFVETWARQLGPYDAELSELIHRAHDAMASLDDLISEAGK